MRPDRKEENVPLPAKGGKKVLPPAFDSARVGSKPSGAAAARCGANPVTPARSGRDSSGLLTLTQRRQGAKTRTALHCYRANCSQPAKKFRGFPFFPLPISINSDLFRISGFGFRISGSAGPRSCGHRSWPALGQASSPGRALRRHCLAARLSPGPRALPWRDGPTEPHPASLAVLDWLSGHPPGSAGPTPLPSATPPG